MVFYPAEWQRKVTRKWLARSGRETAKPTVIADIAENVDDDFSVRCPGCDAAPPIAPICSRYRGPGWVEHVWVCNSCREEWTTSLQVTS